MPASGFNLPLVIQQSLDVTRIQEVTQRLAEVQQAAAGEETAARQRAERTSVGSLKPGSSENRVRSGPDSQRRRRPNRGQPRKAAGKETEESRADSGSGGIAVDVKV